MVSIGEQDDGRTVVVRLDEAVRINLPENAPTGYRWAIERYDQDVLEAVGTEPHYAADAIGAGGRVEFIFQPRKTGATEISLKHWRHWEGDRSVNRRLQIRLDIQP